jgi:hypothetical protein
MLPTKCRRGPGVVVRSVCPPPYEKYEDFERSLSSFKGGHHTEIHYSACHDGQRTHLEEHVRALLKAFKARKNEYTVLFSKSAWFPVRWLGGP